MAETKYGKYFVEEPIEQGPMLHICGDEQCYGKRFPDFPVEVQLLCARPGLVFPEPHSHDVDELFFIFGGNLKNYFEFDAEIEIMMGKGDDQERHIVDKTTIIYIPAGVVHCPVKVLRVGKPFNWMHILFHGKYQMSEGDDMSNHPGHDVRFPYKPDEIVKLRQGITEGIIKPFPPGKPD